MTHAKISNGPIYIDDVLIGDYTNKIIKNELKIFKLNSNAPSFCECVIVDFCAYVKLINSFE